MIVRLAKHSGYCFGVKRAITMALDAANIHSHIYTIGPLIHNPQIVQSLAEQGIVVANDVSAVQNATAIIRSHGISKIEMERLEQNANTIVDATCPYVSRTHEIVSQLVKEGYPVYILGDEEHPEVVGMLSYGNSETRVIKPDFDPEKQRYTKLSLLSQTTQKLDNLQVLVQKLLPVCTELRVFNTICCATSQRQNATMELAHCSDLMIVIGGKNSSNTKMLALLCSEITETLFIETESELNADLIRGKEKIGLSAGASTPDGIIISVYNKIKEINGELPIATSMDAIPVFKEESC